ncbi:beta-N-acetylhexosaminidase [Proteiniborus sp. MB09-C3]|uniref:beta-N-acetylhexosaminidase n=1 Tax=Proteiniborus sp. MB09-C3 TaxID=3050072 RepID=UPI0025565F64|nr:beta-N-acetylhexosaminidase [Proteiniborus sp. MB09-C3]WIV13344.1 beta-N-acetylhexosaminidase [Proteiniborus sp. MB09-C3]
MNTKKIYSCVAFLMILLLLAGCSIGNNDKNSGEKDMSEAEDNHNQEDIQPPVEKIDPIKEQIKEMSIEEKIGQMVVVGLEGYTLDDNSRKMIEEYKVGGIIIFGKNVESSSQLLSLVNSLKETNSKNRIPLFISVDEEGGRVSRMPKEIKKLPTNKKIGQINNKELSYEIGTVLAEELKLFGFNMDFAPVLDINSNPKNPVIGDRSFGTNAAIVSDLGIQTMKGIQSEEVVSVIKHFPGHGDTSVDSHVGLPAVDHDLERLMSFELIPFKEAIDNGADTVMVAHILLKKIDPDYPSSLSKTIITDILREDLGFNGVVISDDMTMGAIAENYEIGDASVNAINAGSDIVLIAHGFDNGVSAINSIKEAVTNGTISEDRLNDSVYRILSLKEKYNMTDETKDTIDTEDINNKFKEILE